MAKLANVLLNIFQFSATAVGFSWTPQKALHPNHGTYGGHRNDVDAVPLPDHRQGFESPYATALKELESLESQPLCHRVAARLLVSNCHLLHGKDEATELADSGRITRDFIDSYAASLAICDLERGSFLIPRECTKFRESALAILSVTKTAYLHVSTLEIDKCLEGLAQSDSSWNTWISYRHKAVHFCEIAKADNEKDSTILLHKKITEIMERLTQKIETQVGEQLHKVQHLVQTTTEVTDSLIPGAESLKTQLNGLDHLINERLIKVSKLSAAEVKAGLEDATRLRNIVNILLDSIRENQVQITMEHSNALQIVRTDAFNGVESIMATIATVASSSVQLQNQLEETELRANRVMKQQDRIEKSLDRLRQVSDEISQSQDSHRDKLDSAHYSVMNILGTLQNVESSTTRIQNKILSGSGWRWWPHIICPATSLLLGSYRLTPSIGRNLILLGLGELAGLTISAVQALQYGTTVPFIQTALFTIFKSDFNDTTTTMKDRHDLGTAASL